MLIADVAKLSYFLLISALNIKDHVHCLLLIGAHLTGADCNWVRHTCSVCDFLVVLMCVSARQQFNNVECTLCQLLLCSASKKF